MTRIQETEPRKFDKPRKSLLDVRLQSGKFLSIFVLVKLKKMTYLVLTHINMIIILPDKQHRQTEQF